MGGLASPGHPTPNSSAQTRVPRLSPLLSPGWSLRDPVAIGTFRRRLRERRAGESLGLPGCHWRPNLPCRAGHRRAAPWDAAPWHHHPNVHSWDPSALRALCPTACPAGSVLHPLLGCFVLSPCPLGSCPCWGCAHWCCTHITVSARNCLAPWWHP